MASNLFTFNPIVGITFGIRLVTDGVNPRTGLPLPAHISCGERFITVEKRWRNVPIKDGLLYDASIFTLTPASGGRSFEVLVPRNIHASKLYVLVDGSTPPGFKVRISAEVMRATACLSKSAIQTILGNSDSESYFLEFEEDGDDVEIWHGNGMISRLMREGDKIVQEPLSFAYMASERIDHFIEQLERLDTTFESDVKRCHGIIAAAMRLLDYTSDTAAQKLLIDFLEDNLHHLTNPLRCEIHDMLRQKGHVRASVFAEGYLADNVVALKTTKSTTSDGKAKALARR